MRFCLFVRSSISSSVIDGPVIKNSAVIFLR